MARIRILDAWVRSPAAPVSRHRAVMVVAEKWAEQRVLMRAYASSQDQTRPTIVLHGKQLAIGPAGTDASSAWGIHVEPPVDGRAQELRAQLELAARRLAGSKGNPPRLMDEVPGFDGRATNHWEPGSAPEPPPPSGQAADPMPYYEPSESAHRGWSSPVAAAPPLHDSHPMPAPVHHPASSAPWPAPPAPYRSPNSVKTQRGIALGYGASWPAPGDPRTAAGSADLRALVRQTMPAGFQLSPAEGQVLDALGTRTFLTTAEIEHLTHATDPAAWMERFMAKLAGFGLDVIHHGGYVNGEATYLLRR